MKNRSSFVEGIHIDQFLMNLEDLLPPQVETKLGNFDVSEVVMLKRRIIRRLLPQDFNVCLEPTVQAIIIRDLENFSTYFGVEIEHQEGTDPTPIILKELRWIKDIRLSCEMCLNDKCKRRDPKSPITLRHKLAMLEKAIRKIL